MQVLRLRGYADFKSFKTARLFLRLRVLQILRLRTIFADFKTAELFLQILRLRDYAGLKTAALETSLQK